jgi:hypothetical protein
VPGTALVCRCRTRPPRLLIVWSPARLSRAATPSLRDSLRSPWNSRPGDQDWLVNGEAEMKWSTGCPVRPLATRGLEPPRSSWPFPPPVPHSDPEPSRSPWKSAKKWALARNYAGGANGTRTRNPLLAKQVRYLLRHGPWQSFPCGRSVAAEDETRIRRPPFHDVHGVCKSGWRHRPQPSERWYRVGGHTRRS